MNKKSKSTISEYISYFYGPLGLIEIKGDNNCINSINFVKKTKKKYLENKITINAKNQLSQYFNKKRKKFDFKLNSKGTPFQKRVWKELQKISYGKLSTYSDVAKKIGVPKGSRAVGQAINKNPVGIVIPCHRVIGKNGALTGYASGLNKKLSLLKLENSYLSVKSK